MHLPSSTLLRFTFNVNGLDRKTDYTSQYEYVFTCKNSLLKIKTDYEKQGS